MEELSTGTGRRAEEGCIDDDDEWATDFDDDEDCSDRFDVTAYASALS